MSTNFIPGYLGTVTIDSESYTVYGNVTGFRGRRNTARKPVFGASAKRVIGGQREFQFSASGHVAAEGPIAELLAAFAAETPVAVLVQVGEASGATDAGTLGGNVVISDLEVKADAEGEWDWSLTAEVDGELNHTPPA